MSDQDTARVLAHIHERRYDRGCQCVFEAEPGHHTVACNKLAHDIESALRSVREEERRRAATICRELPLELEDHKYPSPEERWLMGVAEAGCRNAFAEAIESASEKAGGRDRAG